MEAQAAVHLRGLPICAYRRVFGDTLRGVADRAVHFYTMNYKLVRIAKMKKKIALLSMALFAITSVPLLTSCGGDDDDTTTSQEESKGMPDYVEPCFNWGATLEQVKSYMAGSSWQLTYDQYTLMYTNTNGTCSISYMFRGSTPGLYYDMVQYVGYSENKLSDIVAESEKRYKTTLTKRQEKVEGKTYTQYSGNATINGKYVGILVTSDYSTQITVIIAIPD